MMSERTKAIISNQKFEVDDILRFHGGLLTLIRNCQNVYWYTDDKLLVDDVDETLFYIHSLGVILSETDFPGPADRVYKVI